MASTRQQISEITKLSKSTVAGILQDRPGFNERTRRLVLETAEDLSYRPSRIGRALAGSRSMMLGLVVFRLNIRSSIKKISKIQSQLKRMGYVNFVLELGSDETTDTILDSMRDLLDCKVEGLIIYSPLPVQVHEFLDNQKIPVVYMDCDPSIMRNSILVDRTIGMRQVACHLAQLGHKKVILFMLEREFERKGAKMSYYKRCLEEAGIQVLCGPPWILRAQAEDEYADDAYQTCKKELPYVKNHTSAIVFGEDEAACGAIKAIRETGLTVGRDMSVVGFNDTPLAKYMDPPLTTVRQPGAEVGNAAARTLLKLIKNPEEIVAQFSFNCELVIRESTGPVYRP